MNQDTIVAEVRAIREGLSAQFDFDIGRIVADAKLRQAFSGARVVSLRKSAISTSAAISQEIETPR